MKRILFSTLFFSGYCFSQEADSLNIKSSGKVDSVKISDRKIKTKDIDDGVITGTVKPISISKSPVAVEI